MDRVTEKTAAVLGILDGTTTSEAQRIIELAELHLSLATATAPTRHGRDLFIDPVVRFSPERPLSGAATLDFDVQSEQQPDTVEIILQAEFQPELP